MTVRVALGYHEITLLQSLRFTFLQTTTRYYYTIIVVIILVEFDIYDFNISYSLAWNSFVTSLTFYAFTNDY